MESGFTDLVLWSRGFDKEMFYPAEGGSKKEPSLRRAMAIEKNIEEFLKMESDLPKVVVGGGPMLQNFQEKVSKSDICWFQKGKELADLYRDAAFLSFHQNRYIWYCFD